MNFKFAKMVLSLLRKSSNDRAFAKEILLSPKNWSRIATLWQRLQQSFRLMVGVPDYQTYLEHMKAHHPDLTPMDAQTFYRHCVDARYPSAGGTLKKCPC